MITTCCLETKLQIMSIIINKKAVLSQENRAMPQQWRRQTIKSGSAFKGQLYFQVGQKLRRAKCVFDP